MAEKQSQTYATYTPCGSTSSVKTVESEDALPTTAALNSQKCFFCGYSRHPRSKCPAQNATCKGCGKKGHFLKVCQAKPNAGRSEYASAINPQLSTVISSAAAPLSLSKATINVSINDSSLKALVDTGSSESYICSNLAKSLKLQTFPSKKSISMASTKLSSVTQGHCFVKLCYRGQTYDNVKLSLLPGLCSDIILGHDFLDLHEGLQISFKGEKPIFSVCGVAAAKVEAPSLFQNLTPDCKPIATKSRRFSKPDEQFIDSEIQKLLEDDIIEPSNSPWRAQVLVTTNERHKKRLVVDYSQTINRFTQLDAYPLPRIDEMIENISRYEMYSTLDLRSAYHQIPIKEEERHYTAFEATNNLYHFKRIPFGVTNGVACFQRIMDNMIREEKIKNTFAYLDNVTICGENQEDHDRNIAYFLDCAKKYSITFNEEKSTIGAKEIKLLGYQVSKGNIQPDPERLQPLKELADPSNSKSQQRIIGMFSYYSPWISHFSDKIQPLTTNKTFPLPESVKEAFECLKAEIANAVVVTIDPNLPLVVETDASDIAIAATLNQCGKPVAFFSRSLNPSERNHSSVEKEAYAIVEALRKWKHYLIGKHFRLVTDQKSVSFMFDNTQKGKIKNDKIQRWRIELSCYSYDVVYRPGTENLAADALSRTTCSASTSGSLDRLKEIHDSLSHPGVTRMLHFVKSKNLPYSVQEVKQLITNCKVCNELKPSFYQHSDSHLIKATQPFERLSVDFKGPLPTTSRNRYLLTMIDEHSRFPFAFPCPDMSTSTVIKCFCQLFSLFGMPSYVHSDRGSSFLSYELKEFLHSKGIATSRTTAFNPRGNGQVERLNGTLWRTITLALKTKGLAISQWELVLLDSLHSVRSLLCTATNETPHERLFRYHRKSTTGTALPSWLSTPGPVLMKRNVRASKYEPLVDEVELIDCNPLYAHVKLTDGRETTVSLHQLAPLAGKDVRRTETVNPAPIMQQSPDHLIQEMSADSTGLQPAPIVHQPLDQQPEVQGASDQLLETNEQSDESSVVSKPTRHTPFIRTRSYNLRSRET